MGPTGADDFPKRAVVSDCEPLKLKGRLKEGATAQTQLRGSAGLWHSALRMAFSGAGAALGLDLLPGSGGVRSGFLLLPGHRLPGQQWTPPHLGTEPWLLWGNRPSAQASRPGPRLPGGRPGAGRMTLSEVCFGDRYQQRDSAPRQPSQMACWVGWTNTHTQSDVKNEYVNE